MARKKAQPAPQTPQPQTAQEGITRITIGGFKSFAHEQSIDIKPLTILAGANSSGKTSIMQPLLLLKQTLEAPYNPGPLMLDGPNVNFSEAEQLLARTIDGQAKDTFSVEIVLENNFSIKTFLHKGRDGLFEIEKTIHRNSDANFAIQYCIHSAMPLEDLNKEIFSCFDQFSSTMEKSAVELSSSIEYQISTQSLDLQQIEDLRKLINVLHQSSNTFKESAAQMRTLDQYPFAVSQNRCFLDYSASSKVVADTPDLPFSSQKQIIDNLHQMLHLPGLRGNPQRTYPIIPLGPNFTNFSGTFEIYTASVIHDWQKNKQQEKLDQLNQDLERLGLTNKIVARQITSAHVELMVNRLLHNRDGVEDMVNIVDVGLGVSQAVPVVVALHMAGPGQLVYIEQPEIHLHPRAQIALAGVIVDAALKGKRIVIETHSSLLLLGIQTLVAEKKISADLVRLHWFTQQENGFTQITSADLDKTGAYGDWPEDFDEIALTSESRYIKAAQARLKE